MTIFIVSHNLQVASEAVPPLSASDLAEAFIKNSDVFTVSQALSHSHWLVRLESILSPSEMAEEVVKAWKRYRQSGNQNFDHYWLALGGRKDTPTMPGSPLQPGNWGVAVVECHEPEKFLQDINWPALKSARPVDAVFEIRG